MVDFSNPGYGWNAPNYSAGQLGGILGQQQGGGVLGGNPSIWQRLLDPQTALPMAAAMIAGKTPQDSLAGAFAQAGPGLAATDKRLAINGWLKAGAPKDINHPATQALFKSAPDIAAKYIGDRLGVGASRDIRNDPNGIPRYIDSGEEVFPGVKPREGPEGIFSGKSIMGQGLNYLIAQHIITERQAAELAASKQVTGADGTVYLMTPQGVFGQAPGGGQAEPVVPGEPSPDGSVPDDQSGGAPAGAIPLSGAKTFGGDEQTKAAGFAKRVQNASKVLEQPKVADAGSNYWQHARSGIPLGLGNYAVSEDYQLYDQASRDLINAILRRESGAAISESEFENARQQYLPQPGDTKAKLDQKAANRRQAFENLTRSAGPLNQGFVKGSSEGWHHFDTSAGPLKVREKPAQ